MCIISGAPGVGKSMLAKMLVLAHIDRQFEPIHVTNPTDIEQSWKDGVPQVFYFDDFLGTARLSQLASGGDQDQRLASLIARIKRISNKRLILTTREYLLVAAKDASEAIVRANTDLYKMVVRVEDFTRLHRAEILYNHLFFSRLPGAVLEAFVERRTYKAVVDHENYLPRLVWHISLMPGLEGHSPESFISYVLETLNDPSIVWDGAFRNQLSDTAQWLLLVCASLPDRCNVTAVLKACSALIGAGHFRPGEFVGALRILEGTFTTVTRFGEDAILSLKSPALRDYLIAHLESDRATLERVISSAVFFDQWSTLFRIIETRPDVGMAVERELAKAIRRTFRAPAAGWSGDRTPTSVELFDRAQTVAKSAVTLASLVPVASELMRQLASEVDRSTLTAAVGLCQAAVRATPLREDAERLGTTVLDWSIENADSSEALDAIIELADIFGLDARVDWAEVTRRAEQVMSEEVDSLGYSEDSSEVSSGIDRLERVANKFDLDTMELEDLREHLAMLEYRDESGEDRSDYSYDSTRRSDLSDAKMDELFNGLGQSDR